VHSIGDDVRREMRASATEVRDKLVEARRTSEGRTRSGGGPPRDGAERLKERWTLPETPDLRHAARHTSGRGPELKRQPPDRGRTPGLDRGRPGESGPAAKTPRVERPARPPELRPPEGPKPGERPRIDRGRTPGLDRGRPGESGPAAKTPRIERPAKPPELRQPEVSKPGERPRIDRGRTSSLDRGRPSESGPAAKMPRVERRQPPTRSPSASPAPKVQTPRLPAAGNREVRRPAQPSVRPPQTRSSGNVRAGSTSRAGPSYTRPPAATARSGGQRSTRAASPSARSGRSANRPGDGGGRGRGDRGRGR